MVKRNKKLHIVVLSVCVAILILMGISFATSGSSSASGNIVGTVLSPVQKFFSSIGNGVGGFFDFVFDMKNFQQENLELKDEVNRLSARVRELEAFGKENERLRQMLELKEAETERDIVCCEVIAKDPGNWFYSFTIDKGKGDGLKVDDTVMSGYGLVGRITEVGPNWAKVVTIIDSESSVGALVSRTQDLAIVDGDLYLADDGKCKLNYLTKDTSLVLGDTIVTSGLGGVYPEGILIGTVSEIKSDSMGYSQYAVIDTAVNFEKIQEVMVIRNGR
ncbi:MAG: rod shape-determining protein MreC [Clostridia bacterium]|nr:rod shape-determining protein MreC [Clostridia bacterium]